MKIRFFKTQFFNIILMLVIKILERFYLSGSLNSFRKGEEI